MADNTMIKEKIAVSKSKIVAVADAIRDKTNSSDALTLDAMPEAINGIKGGGAATVEEKDINFYDYNGTLLYSYTKEEFQAINSLPKLPVDESNFVECVGWNWSLDNAKNEADVMGKCNISAYYKPCHNGILHLLVELDKNHLNPYLNLRCIDGTRSFKVDWGDGNIEDIEIKNNISCQHNFSTAGTYIIKILPPDTGIVGNLAVYNKNSYGYGENNVSTLFSGSPNFDQNVVYNAGYAQCVKAVATSENFDLRDGCFMGMTNLSCAAIYPQRGYGMKLPGYCFYGAGLKFFSTADNICYVGEYCFYECKELEKVVLGDQVNSLYDYFASGSLKENILTSKISSISQYAFSDSWINGKIDLNKIKLTALGKYCFQNSRITEFEMNDSLQIPEFCFAGCKSLGRVSLNTSKVSSYAFNGCGLIEVDMTKCASVPTLSSTSAFSLADCSKIVVPESLYAEWVVATNWTTFSDYIYCKNSDGEYYKPTA